MTDTTDTIVGTTVGLVSLAVAANIANKFLKGTTDSLKIKQPKKSGGKIKW